MCDQRITRDMFNALDYEKKGSVSKQHLINQMSDYLSENDLDKDAISKISFLDNYPDTIDYENFKKIYIHLTESNISYEEDDEDEDVLICSMYEEIIEGNGSDSDISNNEIWSLREDEESRGNINGSVINVMKPLSTSTASSDSQNEMTKSNYYTQIGSLRRRTIDKIVSARSSIGHTIHTSEEYRDEFDELSYMTDSGMSLAAEEVDKLADSYNSVVKELTDLRQKLDDSSMKCVNQRELTKVHNNRIMILEEQIRQLESMQQEQMELKRKESRSSKNNKEQRKELEKEEQIYNDGLFRDQVLSRLNTLESEYNASNAEYEKMKQECTDLIQEKEIMEKELRQSDKRCIDLEYELRNYRDAVTHQISELQRERDSAEKINKELYDKLQDARSSYNDNDQNTALKFTSRKNSPALDRPPSWTGTIDFIRSNSSVSKHSFESGSAMSSAPSCTTMSQLERIVHCLTMDNRNLVEKVAHLETLEFYQRQRIYVSNNMSLANELEQLNVTELKKALTAEREIAKRLQLYMMGLTNRLMLAGYIEAFRHG